MLVAAGMVGLLFTWQLARGHLSILEFLVARGADVRQKISRHRHRRFYNAEHQAFGLVSAQQEPLASNWPLRSSDHDSLNHGGCDVRRASACS